MKTKGTKRGLATLLALVMVLFAVPFTAHAAESPVTLDLAQGTITITETGYTAAGASNETAYTGNYYIMQSNNETVTENCIRVKSGTHNITIDGLYCKNMSAIELTNGTDVKLTLVNSSNLLSGTNSYSEPMIYVPKGAALTIDGSGSLNIDVTRTNAAGMGGMHANQTGTGYILSYGDITINGGNIAIKAGTYGAAIGKSYKGTMPNSEDDSSPGTITINGGTLDLRTCEGSSSAVIGGAFEKKTGYKE